MPSTVNQSIHKVSPSKSTINVKYNTKSVEYLNIWLRDNCQCPQCYDAATYQRLLDTFAIPKDIEARSTSFSESRLAVDWSDGHSSAYSIDWLISHTKEFTKPSPVKQNTFPSRVYWTKDLINRETPVVDYKDVLDKSSELYNNIWKYGFTFIENIPVTPEDTETLLNAIGYIRHTHYGGFWDFTSDLSMKDTAYSDIEIPSHTDGTYWESTPYLQLFHLLFHDGEGGDTTLVDAFKCAQDFKAEYPDYYQYLSDLKVDCHSLGDVYLTQSKPIFIHDSETKELVQVSWNNSDRSTNFKLSNEELAKFYDAIRAWNELIHREENILFHRLEPGTALIFDNWRTFHARIGKFTGKRRMCGAYFDREDFLSTLTIQNSKDSTQLFNSV